MPCKADKQEEQFAQEFKHVNLHRERIRCRSPPTSYQPVPERIGKESENSSGAASRRAQRNQPGKMFDSPLLQFMTSATFKKPPDEAKTPAETQGDHATTEGPGKSSDVEEEGGANFLAVREEDKGEEGGLLKRLSSAYASRDPPHPQQSASTLWSLTGGQMQMGAPGVSSLSCSSASAEVGLHTQGGGQGEESRGDPVGGDGEPFRGSSDAEGEASEKVTMTKKMLRMELEKTRQDTLTSVEQMLNDHFEIVSALVEKESSRVRVEKGQPSKKSNLLVRDRSRKTEGEISNSTPGAGAGGEKGKGCPRQFADPLDYFLDSDVERERERLQCFRLYTPAGSPEGSDAEDRFEDKGSFEEVHTETCGDEPGAVDLPPLSEKCPSMIGDAHCAVAAEEEEEEEEGEGDQGGMKTAAAGETTPEEKEKEEDHREIEKANPMGNTADEEEEQETETKQVPPKEEREEGMWVDDDDEEEEDGEEEGSEPQCTDEVEENSRQRRRGVHSTVSEGTSLMIGTGKTYQRGRSHSSHFHHSSSTQHPHSVPRLRHSVCHHHPLPPTSAGEPSFSLAAFWQVPSALALPLTIRKEVTNALDSLRRSTQSRPRSPSYIHRRELASVRRQRERDRQVPESHRTVIVPRSSPSGPTRKRDKQQQREKEEDSVNRGEDRMGGQERNLQEGTDETPIRTVTRQTNTQDGQESNDSSGQKKISPEVSSSKNKNRNERDDENQDQPANLNPNSSRTSSQETSELIPFEELKSFQRGYGSVRHSLAIARVKREVEAAERARRRREEEERSRSVGGPFSFGSALLTGGQRMPPMMLSETAANPHQELSRASFFSYRRPKAGLTDEEKEQRRTRRTERRKRNLQESKSLTMKMPGGEELNEELFKQAEEEEDVINNGENEKEEEKEQGGEKNECERERGDPQTMWEKTEREEEKQGGKKEKEEISNREDKSPSRKNTKTPSLPEKEKSNQALHLSSAGKGGDSAAGEGSFSLPATFGASFVELGEGKTAGKGQKMSVISYCEEGDESQEEAQGSSEEEEEDREEEEGDEEQGEEEGGSFVAESLMLL
uniref:Uncharacterized protein n=1 Tax=Chromera velia CCMP2878 TaxID=1169474 RepID=A0A0G4FHP2_9ALVE|eukprot:Cvel_17060.t1-p1 / transcript=Cvel_17060.t1 / gene=Cvel_17060 / organism=Chromera_velia_CCMP2878 / gene_product=hypothetical protein / transcript_product=hypothetical protein / location=Cvel_scaffold1344:18622-25736(-) / protein_length=1066 / sequence_SO=supercontig / SO=protein_coding / is_pseudo=false